MEITPSLVIAYALNIGILFVILKYVLYKPVRKYLDEREARYKRRTEDIERREHDSTEKQAQYEELMSCAQEQSDTLVREARSAANRRAEEILADAQKQADELIRQARRQIADEQRAAKFEMREQIVDLAVDMASRILEREVTADDHKRIVDRFLKSQKVR